MGRIFHRKIFSIAGTLFLKWGAEKLIVSEATNDRAVITPSFIAIQLELYEL